MRSPIALIARNRSVPSDYFFSKSALRLAGVR
jgi:hypothetical protein